MKEIKIGDQVWMSENLSVDTFRNGDPIPEAKTDEEWAESSARAKPVWCWSSDDPKERILYGKLYNHYAVIDPRGLAPEGWRIPSYEELEGLILDGELRNEINLPMAGVREVGNTVFGSSIFLIGEEGRYWSSEHPADYPGYLLATKNEAFMGSDLQYLGQSIRCIKGEEEINRIWMSENLSVDTFRNGDLIPEAITNEDWILAGKRREPAWCWPTSDIEKRKSFGKLYNHYAVADSRGLSPEGWRIPTEKELEGLILVLPSDDFRLSKIHLPMAGYRYDSNGLFDFLGSYGFYWSSTIIGTNAKSLFFHDDGIYWDGIYRNPENIAYMSSRNRSLGFSVRCFKD